MKIEKIKQLLDENSSMVGAVQERITFNQFQLNKIKELQNLFSEKYGITRKADVISIAIISLLLGEQKDGKE